MNEHDEIKLAVVDLTHDGSHAFLVRALGEDGAAQLKVTLAGRSLRFVWIIRMPTDLMQMSAEERRNSRGYKYTNLLSFCVSEEQMIAGYWASLRSAGSRLLRACDMVLYTCLPAHLQSELLVLTDTRVVGMNIDPSEPDDWRDVPHVNIGPPT